MRVIPVNVHNILDYLYAAVIIISPWLFGFANDGLATYIPVAAGTVVLIISLITNYRYSLAKIIAFNTHLTLDLIIGFILLISPWMFGFNNYVFIPHVILGLTAMLVSLMSRRFVNYREY